MTPTANILIVDDLESNRDTLESFVTALGHTPILAEQGLRGLEIVQSQAIDLILLDIMMPGMEGYEFLSHIKDNPHWQHIPVIMITAIDEMDSVIHCIKMGADDYLTKPFNSTLLKARIGACLERKYLLDKEREYLAQIEEYNHKLEERVQARTQELAAAKEQLEKLNQIKDEALSLLYYELQKPFKGILNTFKRYFTGRIHDVNQLLETAKQSILVTQISSTIHIYPFEISNINTILASAMAVTRDLAQERQVLLGEMPNCGSQTLEQSSLYSLIATDQDDIYDDIADYSLSQHITKQLNRSSNHQNKLCAEAIAELLKVAIKFSNPDSTIVLSCQPLEQEIVLGIHATGRLVADETLSQFFQAPMSDNSMTLSRHPGLGTSVAYYILTSLGGSVTVNNRDTKGISLTVTLKRKPL